MKPDSDLSSILDYCDKFYAEKLTAVGSHGFDLHGLFDGASVNCIPATSDGLSEDAAVYRRWCEEIQFSDVGRIGQRAAIRWHNKGVEFGMISLTRPTVMEAYRGAFAVVNILGRDIDLDPRRVYVRTLVDRQMNSLDGLGVCRADVKLNPAKLLLLTGFINRYNWKCRMWVSGRSLSFHTDQIGCREALRLRDVEPGKKRRTALLHWVSAHHRKARDGAERVDIREHLRGRETASVDGFKVAIYPSAFDAERSKRPDLAEPAEA